MIDRTSGALPPSTAGHRTPTAVDGTDLPQFYDYAPWVNTVCGFLVFVLRYASPRPTFGVHWNLFLTGFVIMFAAVGAEIAHGNSARNYWSAINLVAGVWLLVSAQTIPSILPVTFAQEGLGGGHPHRTRDRPH